MSLKIKGVDGREVEHFTQEEVDAKLKLAQEEKEKEFNTTIEKAKEEALEEYKKNNPDRKEDIDKLQTELTSTKDELEKLKNLGEDPNMPEGQKTRLLTKIVDLEKKIDDVTKTSKEEIERLVKDKTIDQKSTFLKRLTGEDAELSKKVEYYFDNYMPDKTDVDSMKSRMEVAFKLATNNEPKPGVLDGAFGANIKGDGNPEFNKNNNVSGTQPTANEKAIGSVLGISEADREKFGKIDASKPNAISTTV